MNALPTVDMAEVTRLTRAGRLTEAMAMLRGGASARPSEVPTGGDGQDAATLDLAKPATPGDAWALPTASAAPLGVPAAAFAGGASRLASWFSTPGAPMRENAGAPPVASGARFVQLACAEGASGRTFKLYVPSGAADRPRPLVVMLHGCKQSPDDFAAGTGMNALAEDQGVLVAYPDQPRSANVSRCWNWFDPANQGRGSGEPAIIAGIVRQVVREFGADPARVYVAGLSAGGAAAAVLAASYPDVFAAVGIHSGLACGAASDVSSAFAAMAGGEPARRLSAPVTVPTIVFQGDADGTVHPVNAERILAGCALGGDLVRTESEGVAPGGVRFKRIAHTDETGRSVAEHWVLRGAGHAWSGGNRAGSYTDPRGPDASREMLRFFAQHARQAN